MSAETFPLPDRGLLEVTGSDRAAFLQGLVTCDVAALGEGQAAYGLLLSPQGRFLHDFFVLAQPDRLLIDCESARRDDLMRRLRMFRLRAQVEIEDMTETFNICHSRESGKPEMSYADPRHETLGYRVICGLDSSLRGNDGDWEVYDRTRIALGLPDGSRDMVPGEALPMENNIDQAHGIAWNKGCYVGQELTARMKYKAQIKRRLTPVRIEVPAIPPGTILAASGAEVGEMRSSCGDIGLAMLRLDAEGPFMAGDKKLSRL